MGPIGFSRTPELYGLNRGSGKADRAAENEGVGDADLIRQITQKQRAEWRQSQSAHGVKSHRPAEHGIFGECLDLRVAGDRDAEITEARRRIDSTCRSESPASR